ncbi:MAG TPA: hypothetical protein VEV43_08310 [Actinomycetota bacterium]|nr:hypothetical protein [Actinomycetota bacterium]
MSRRVRLVVMATLYATILAAAPAEAEECVEVLQFKHCFPGGD